MFNLSDARKWALAALGSGLSQLGAGQPVNIAGSAAGQMIQQRQNRQRLEESGLLDRFDSAQRAVLAQMEPSAAIKVIAGQAFAGPAKPIVVGDRLVHPTTGKVVADFSTPPALPADIQKYEYAVSQGYAGDITQWMRENRASGATTVNIGADGVDYGTPPKDMAWLRNEDNSVKIDQQGAPMATVVKGSETDRKQIEATAKRTQGAIDAAESGEEKGLLVSRAGNVVLEDIQRVQKKIESAPWYSPTSGMLGDVLKDVGGTRAADVKALTTTIKANIGFDRLQQMREASPTGGALGQVSNQELGTLQAVLGSLEQDQSEDQLLENLERLEVIYTDIMRKFSAYPNAAEFGVAAPETDTGGPKAGLIEDGYRFKGGDPAVPENWEKID